MSQPPIRRTFHIPTKGAHTLDVSECGQSISITTGTEETFLTREQFEALCSLRYEIRWDALEELPQMYNPALDISEPTV